MPSRQGYLVVSIVALVLALALLIIAVVAADAAPLAGNKGGCGRGNLITLTCNVSDAGPGFVSGSCDWGHYFSRVATSRTFRIGQVVTVRACEGLGQELYAPIRITR